MTVDSDGLVVEPGSRTIRNCARCGGTHEDLMFHRLGQPVLDVSDRVVATHWATCPTSGEPLLDFRGEPSKYYGDYEVCLVRIDPAASLRRWRVFIITGAEAIAAFKASVEAMTDLSTASREGSGFLFGLEDIEKKFQEDLEDPGTFERLRSTAESRVSLEANCPQTVSSFIFEALPCSMVDVRGTSSFIFNDQQSSLVDVRGTFRWKDHESQDT